MTQEELQLVLNALKWCHGGEPCGTAEAIAVIEKALANVATNDTSKEYVDEMQKQRHEQEPVAWFSPSGNLYKTRFHAAANGEQVVTPLYTTPPQRKPLTDEEIDHIYTGVQAIHHEIDSYVFARAIEAYLKEKNT